MLFVLKEDKTTGFFCVIYFIFSVIIDECEYEKTLDYIYFYYVQMS